MKNFAGIMQRHIDRMFDWMAEPQTKVGNDKPYLTERCGIRAMHFSSSSVQSEMSIDMPDKLVMGCTRSMMNFLLFEPSPKCIAMIGLGGGSIAKYCYRYLPQAEITVIEINPDVIALRNEFAIPSEDARFQVLMGDGAEWVTAATRKPDVLIVDGFDANGLPVQLTSQRFYDDCFASLTDNGIMVANLWSGYPHYDEYVARISNSFAGSIVIIDADDSVNSIVVAVKNAEFPPSSPVIQHHAKLLCLSHPLNFHAKSNRLIQALSIRHPE